MKKKIFSILLVICMLLTWLPATASASGSDSASAGTWSELLTAVGNAKTDGTQMIITVTANLTATEECDIENGKDIVIQSLSGNTLTYGDGFTSFLFTVTGALTLKDITVEGNSNNTITRPVVYMFAGAFTMDGAAIQNIKANVDNGWGAAAHVPLGCTMTVKNGSVIDNVNNNDGNAGGYGGITVGGTLAIVGSSVKNTVGGGIIDFPGGNISLSGSSDISGNMLNGSTPCNLYLYSGSVITVNAPFTPTSPIGVMTEEAPSAGSPVNLMAASGTDWSSCFTSDTSGYAVVNSGSGSSQVVQLTAPDTIDVSLSSQTLPTGVSYGSNLFTIGTLANNSTITVTGATSANTIAVANGVTGLTLILDTVSITGSFTGARSPVELQGNANVTITLADGTTNMLDAYGASGKAGLCVPSGAVLTIDGSGTLNAKGYNNSSNNGGAGIGGETGGACGTVNISGGYITAKGGNNGGAGIGGGYNGAGGAIHISGGTIDAAGGESLDNGSAGIGGGYNGAGGAITISNATVTAKGSGTTPGFGGAGIGGGKSGAGGTITIHSGTVTATGGDSGAGIGGGRSGAGGTITINGGTVVATGADYGAGIGGGWQGASAIVTINGTPTIMAASSGGSGYKNAIDASAGSSGNIINAKLNSYLDNSKRYLMCGSSVLPFPAYCTNFAFTAPAASPVKAYYDSGHTTFFGSIITNPAGDVSIPVTDLSISPSVATSVKVFAPTVTVNKNGTPWSPSTPTIELSTSDTSSAGAIFYSMCVSGVATFFGLDASNTYYVWNTSSGQYTGKSITSTSPNVTVDYYTVALTSGTGISSTSGSGTYLSGSNVNISATVSAGYNWSKWTQTSGGTLVTTSNLYTIPNVSSAITYTASTTSNAPGIVTTALPNAVFGTAYSQNLTATSLVPLTLTWSVTAGALPAGLTLNANTGVISGTPSAAGMSSFTVTATDSNGSVSRALTITVDNIYALTVNLGGGSGGTTGGSYDSGATVSINAGTKSGYTFSGWSSSNGGTFDNASSASTTFTMPGNATTITANWTQNGVGGGGYTPPANSNTIVIVDNKDYSIGTENKNDQNTTATVDQDKLTDEIGKASDSSSVIFPVSANANVTAQLVVKNIEDMAKKDMILTVQTGNVSYNLNTSAIDISKITASLGNADSKDIPFNVSISNSNAVVNGATVVVSPVEFTITATYNGKMVSVNTFSCFVSRTVEITADQAKQVSTAVVVEADGTLRHVPTKVTVIYGKYYAVISSLTNSTYTVVWNPVSFGDVIGHWAKAAVNDMGSRKVVTGVGNNAYEPDRDITRAEFAAIVVRALGLDVGTGSSFTDVTCGAWYDGYIQTAVGYGIVNGYGDGTFGPQDTITREQAMTMIARAMKITKLDPTLTDTQVASLLSKYTDSSAVSNYAKASVAACVDTGVVLGRPNNTVASKDFITRAEVAVIVERMLQKSNLI